MSTPTSQSGFTIIEALVAIAILLIAIAGPMTIAMQGIKQGAHARDQVTAFYLGQEAIEIIRATRDDAALRGDSWGTGIGASCASGCGIAINGRNFVACSVGTGNPTNCNIFYNPNGVTGARRGIYSHTPDVATVYNRTITISPAGTDEYVVDATVTWRSRIFPAGTSLTVRGRIFDIYDNI